MRVKNFFKSDRLEHKDPAVRIQAIEALDAADQEQQRALGNLLGTELDESVRAAALQKLSSVEVLLENLNGRQFKPNLVSAIEDRLIQVLESVGMPEDSLATLLQSTNDVTNVLVASHSALPEQRALVMKSITEDPLLLRVIGDAKYHETRLEAAEKLSNEAAWKEGVNLCKTRDKVVAKLLQAKLDEKVAAEAAEQKSFDEIKTTVAAMKALASTVWSPQHAGKFQALIDKWINADQAHTVSVASEFDEAKMVVQTLLDEHEKKASAAISVPPSNETTDHSAKASTSTPISVSPPATTAGQTGSANTSTSSTANTDDVGSEKALAIWGDLASSSLSELPSKLEQVKTNHAQTDEQGQALLSHAAAITVLFDPPFDVNKARPGAIQERIKRVDTLLTPDKKLIRVDLDSAAYIKEFSEHKHLLLSRLDKARQESQDRIKATHRQFGALGGLVSSGKWGPANSMMLRLKKKLGAMEAAERNKFNDKLKRAEKQLDEMADWQDFAAKPKLLLVCEEMEALPAKELKPPALAKEVKRLQEAWKTLGISRASNELWARFKTAGDTAYEPCKAFFEERQKERQLKIDAKGDICKALDAEFEATDWEAPDWKAIARLVANSKRNWSQNRVTDRKPDKKLEQQFSDCLKKFESRLGEQFDANAVLKKEMVEKAKALAEGEVNQHNINQVKKLQASWKQVGVMRRAEDQTLWEEFNGYCRVIFKQQRAVEQEKYKASMGHVFRAKDIIKELRTLSKTANPDDNKVQELTTEFNALEEFPDKDKKFLLRDFRGALDSVGKAAANQSRKKAHAEHEELLRQVSLCEQIEAFVEAGNATDNAIEDINHAWSNSEVSLAKEIAAKLRKRRDKALGHIEAKSQFDYAKSEEIRRNLLIKMEIAADIETPSEDKPRRMAYQLEHLRDGMTSSAIADSKKLLRDLEMEWFIAPPVKSELSSNLQSRYLKALGK